MRRSIVAWLVSSAALALQRQAAARPEERWQAWLEGFGHDSYAYPAWIAGQMRACTCEETADGAVACQDAGKPVDWQAAEELTWCSAKHYLLNRMPEFDRAFLPAAVTVEATSMLDDNIAFTLMAWNASSLNPKPPLKVVWPYILPYATYHESRVNWRPIFFAKYAALGLGHTTSRSVLEAFISGGVPLMNWTAHKWASYSGQSAGNVYELGPFASGSTPPVVGPFDFTAYGYGSCTAWAKLLASALKAVGVPAREVGSPCWDSDDFAGLAASNPNVSACWNAGMPGGPVGGKFLNNHNWVEYWDNQDGSWHFVDVAVSSTEEKTWFCGSFAGGCECSSKAGKAGRDHEIFAPTWASVADDHEFDGGEVIDVASDLKLSTGEAVSPLVWSPRLRSPLGKPLAAVGLRLVNRSTFYRCRKAKAATTDEVA